MTDSETWAREFFTSLFVDLWLACTSEAQTKQEADYLVNVLQPPAGGKLLDLACGGGRHSHELAARGYRLTGVDLSSEFLAHARKSNLPIQWEQRPIFDLPWESEYDGAYCMGNSLGGLDDAAHCAFFAAVAKALKPGARFTIDTGVIAESILPTMKERTWWQIGDMLFLLHNTYDHAQSRLNMDFTIQRGREEEKKSGFSQVYTFREFSQRLAAAGFGEFTTHAGTDELPYRLGSQRLLLTMRKKL